jgi:hypothetical protein
MCRSDQPGQERHKRYRISVRSEMTKQLSRMAIRLHPVTSPASSTKHSRWIGADWVLARRRSDERTRLWCPFPTRFVQRVCTNAHVLHPGAPSLTPNGSKEIGPFVTVMSSPYMPYDLTSLRGSSRPWCRPTCASLRDIPREAALCFRINLAFFRRFKRQVMLPLRYDCDAVLP